MTPESQQQQGTGGFAGAAVFRDQQGGGVTGYVEQKIYEFRNLANSCTNPTAREVLQHAIALVEAGWLIERNGGSITPQQQSRQYQLGR